MSAAEAERQRQDAMRRLAGEYRPKLTYDQALLYIEYSMRKAGQIAENAHATAATEISRESVATFNKLVREDLKPAPMIPCGFQWWRGMCVSQLIGQLELEPNEEHESEPRVA